MIQLCEYSHKNMRDYKKIVSIGGIICICTLLFSGIFFYTHVENNNTKADIFDTDNDCSGPDGATIADGTTRDYYFVASSTDCANQKESRLCTAGNLGGSALISSCSAPSNQSCTDPEGTVLQNGQSKTYYSAQQNNNCGSISTTRTCNNGVLGGDTSFQFSSCTDFSSCVGPDGSTIANGSSKLYYEVSEDVNCSSKTEVRSCNNGTLSGGYTFASCSGLGDSDGDGDPDNTDPDDDNDGVNDENDAFPLDRTESLDTDGDGQGNNADSDDDNDGFSDTEEINARSNPLDPYSTPNKDNYGLCEIWKNEAEENISWTATDYSYEKTTSEVVDGEVVETTETIVDPIKSGSFTCTGPGGNYTEGNISELPDTKSGSLTLPTGFPLLNDMSCGITITTEEGITSTCSVSQKLVSINTVNVNGEGNTWHFPMSVQGTKIVPLIYGGNTHEIFGETDGTNAVSKQTQIILVTDKKSDEQLEWSSPRGDTGSLRDYNDPSIECLPDSPCTGERVVFTSTDKQGTSSILLYNASTKESASFTVHILPSAVESFTLQNPSALKVYEGSRVDLTATMNLFNGDSREGTQEELEWEFSSDGGATWLTQNESGTTSGGVFIPKKEGLYTLRAKTTNVYAGLDEDSLKYKTDEIISENTIQIEVRKAPESFVTINGEVAPWHFPVSQIGTKQVTQIYGGNSSYFTHLDPSTTVSATPNPTPTATPDPLVSSVQTASPTPTPVPTPNCSVYGCSGIYSENVSTETSIVLNTHIKEGDSVEWSSPVSDTGSLTDYVTGQACLPDVPCTGDRVLYSGGTKEGVSSISLRNVTEEISMTYTVYTLPSAVESIRMENESIQQKYLNDTINLSANIEYFNGITNDLFDDLSWEFSYDGGTTWTKSSEDGVVSGGEFIPKKEGLVALRAKIQEKRAIVGAESLLYKHHEVISDNTLQFEVLPPLESGSVMINGKSAPWHFPVAQKGVADVIQVYGGNSSYFAHLGIQESVSPTPTPSPSPSPSDSSSIFTTPTPTPTSTPSTTPDTGHCEIYGCSGVYSENVSTETSIVLNTHIKDGDMIEWISPETDTGYLEDFITGQKCLPTDPCTGEKVVYHGGAKEGVSSIVLNNRTENTSHTYTVYTLPPAIESIQLDTETLLKGYMNKKIDLTAQTQYFNGTYAVKNADELFWEFSYDGGTTWSQSNENGVVSGGEFIPKKEGLVAFRASIEEKRAIVGPETLLYKTHIVESANTLQFEIFPALESRVTINGEQGNFVFPVSTMGTKDISLAYGERIITTATPTPTLSLLPSPAETFSPTPSPTPDPSESVTPTPSPTPTPIDLANSNNPIPNGSREILTVAKQTHFLLEIEKIEGEDIQWHTSISDTGYLEDTLTKQKCVPENPCEGEKVSFYGGEKEGTSSIVLHNKATQEIISYEVQTLPSATERIFVKPFTTDMYYAYEDIDLLADMYLYNGKVETLSEEVLWQFSYDGGTTWQHNSQDGIISSGVFTPYKTGNVSIRAFTKEVLASYGIGELSKEDHIILSENTTNITIDQPRIIIEQAHLLGNNRITRNTDTNVSVGLSSRDAINKQQSLSVMLMADHIDETTYVSTINPVYVFKEYQNESSVKEFLESDGNRNYGIVDIPIFIPEYDAKRDMRDGPYTIMIVLHKDDRVVSRYFIPVILGEEYGQCDINDDGFENVIDLILTLKFLNGSLIPTAAEKKRVDMTANGILDLKDMLQVFSCVLN